ncbi:helix-turn-helix transcriptional regulator [Chitinimonas sp.]|uniref:AraC family transcriptional regulator n=1 Tax=Chitinimonas sp. TaxID=1934313 RepID=UPI002F920217
MPLLTKQSASIDWFDPDDVPRDVVTLGAAGVEIGGPNSAETTFGERKERGFHRHRKGELLLTLRGVITLEVEGGLWIVPPQSAIWVPGGVVHKFTASGTIDCYVLFIENSVATGLPATCSSLATTPLLRELLVRSASLPVLYPEGGMASHLVTLLLDELALAPVGNLHLPMPTDPRLRKIAETIMNDPADRGTIASWGRRVGLSERTLARLLKQQTGMSFGRWRQQLQLMLAVRWLGSGASVQQVSDDLGYESAGSFVTMFRKALGTSPGRYIARSGL